MTERRTTMGRLFRGAVANAGGDRHQPLFDVTLTATERVSGTPLRMDGAKTAGGTTEQPCDSAPPDTISTVTKTASKTGRIKLTIANWGVATSPIVVVGTVWKSCASGSSKTESVDSDWVPKSPHGAASTQRASVAFRSLLFRISCLRNSPRGPRSLASEYGCTCPADGWSLNRNKTPKPPRLRNRCILTIRAFPARTFSRQNRLVAGLSRITQRHSSTGIDTLYSFVLFD